MQNTSTINTSVIDESLYSRQIFALGKDAMKKMTESSVLITCRGNFSGAALELAKCTILAGVKRVTLHSNTDILTYRDLSTNYYASEGDVGKPFFNKVVQQLSSLNPYVKVDTIKTLSSGVQNYTCVVFCDYDIHKLFYWNNLCRTNGVKFIMLQSYGLMFHLFCDFGNEHIVSDKDGEPSVSGIVTKVNTNRIVTTDPHNVFTGDVIQFDGSINGLTTHINGEPKLYIVKIINSTEFELREYREDHRSGSNMMSQQDRQIETFRTLPVIIPDQTVVGVTFKQEKIPVTFRFKSLVEALKDPQYVMFDTEDWDMPKILNTFMKAISIWRLDNKFIFDESTFVDDVWEMYPISHEDITSLKKYFDQELLVSKAKDKLYPSKHVDQVFELLAQTCSGSICGIDSIAGSICAQEVIKAVSNKFTPTNQFLHFETLNVLPDWYLYLKERTNDSENYTPSNSRYDGQIVVFGHKYIETLQDKKLFIVGAGAIGCEHVKNFSMMGIRNMTITDMDHIENSNLNRQFLFRKEDIGQPKSITAAKKAKTMNPDINIVSQENKVCKDTLNVYNQDFFNNTDIIANALDNIEARLFVDSLCVKYKLPLLESGTLGTKGNVQCIIPDLTESYGSLQDPPEQSIAVCTLKLFPYKYEHIVQYARDMFEGFFNRIPGNCKRVQDVNVLKTLTPDEITNIYDDIMTFTKNCNNFKYCINFAYKQFHVLFRDLPNQIIKKYPKDHVDDEGNLFWSGNRIFPKSYDFDVNNKTDLDFIVAFSHIWADACGIPSNKRYPVTRRDRFVKFIQRLTPPKESMCKDVSQNMSESDKNDKKPKSRKITNDNESMILEIEQCVIEKNKLFSNLTSISFEKDDDTNNHIDFITACSNKRAENYHIESKDRLATKGIAGKIIPAIATTTSIVSGLIALEMYKVVFGMIYKDTYNTLQRYRYGSFNLAVQSFGFGESYPAKTTNIDDELYSIWTRVDIDADSSLESVIDSWSNVVITKMLNGKKIKNCMNMDFLSSDHGVIFSGAMQNFNNDDNNDDITQKSLRELILQNNSNAKGDQLLTMTFAEDIDSEEDDGTLPMIDDTVVTVRVCL
jgi:ubiquitin-activating enzyme E1